MNCRYRSRLKQCNKEAARDGLCEKHGRKCDEYGCVRFTDKTYCAEHACDSSGCNLKKCGKGNSCTNHGCMVPVELHGKDVPCGNARKGKSAYCIEHACANTKCQNPCGIKGEYCNTHGCKSQVNGRYCGASCAPASYVCMEHVCAGDDCSHERAEGGDYCNKHTCSAEGCRSGCVPESEFCAAHCCDTDGCVLGAGSNGQSCKIHGCMAFEDGTYCGRQYKYDSHYCDEHACTECARPRDGNGECCEKHGCVYESDKQACRVKRKDDSKWCKNHACSVDGCGDPRKGTECCKRHGCKHQPEGQHACGRPKKGGSDYCTSHSCTHPQCGRLKKSRTACDRHACGSLISDNEKQVCGSLKSEGSKWCVEHTCAYGGCKESNIGIGVCCAAHGCQYNLADLGRLCMEPRKKGSNHCESHTCKVCDRYTLFSDGRYCDVHTCAHEIGGRRACAEPKTSGRHLCESHMLDEQAAASVPDAVAGAVITSGVGTSQDARFSEIEAKLKEGGLSAIRVIHKPEVTWDNVAGAKDAKNAIQQSILRPYKRPDLYAAGWDNGMLLYGPPGTGKTLLITATANEVDGTVLEVKTSSIQSKWSGETEKHIATLFKISHDHSDRHKRPVIIFIDEADALFGENKSNEQKWETAQRNELLSAMDGSEHKGKKSFVYVVGATNMPWNIGMQFKRRFENRIYVGLPDESARTDLFKIHASKFNMSDEVDFATLAENSERYSGSDIMQVCKKADMITTDEAWAGDVVPETKRDISMDDFAAVLQKVQPTTSAEDLRRYETWNSS